MSDTPTNRPSRIEAHSGLVLGGRYRLSRRIANGGMAAVWEAIDEVLRRPVAVKILHHHLTEDATFMARFRTEAVAIARLHHPSIVTIYDTSHDSGIEAIVMELIRGRTLREYLDEQGRLDPSEVFQIGGDVADALDTAHRAGIIHRDIKPANILLSDDGRVLVTDFGIAKIRDDPDLTSTGTMLGSVKYLAPEQVEGKRVDPRTDIYALGVVLYEATCGQPPFIGDSPAATALARLHQDPPPARSLRPELPAEVTSILDRCLKRDPDKRFGSAEELGSAIKALPFAGSVHWRDDPDLTIVNASPKANLEEPPSSPTDSDPELSYRRPVRTGPFLLMILAVVALVVAAMLIWEVDPAPDPVGEPMDRTDTTTNTPSSVNVAGVTPFDPQGTGTPGENDADAPLAIDGSIATAWRSERYATRRFGDLKAGVGLILTLEESRKLDQIVVHSDALDWSGSVYISDRSGETIGEWGPPVATLINIDGDATFKLNGATGRFVLVWVSDLGDGKPPLTASVSEIILTPVNR